MAHTDNNTTYPGPINPSLLSSIAEIDSQIRAKGARLGQLKALLSLSSSSSSSPSQPPTTNHPPLLVNPRLRPVPPPSPRVLRFVFKRLRAHRRHILAFRDVYTSQATALKESHKAKWRRIQMRESKHDRLLRDQRELSLVGDVHGMSTATPASRHSVERQLRMLRRGGGTLPAPGNDYHASSTLAGHGLGVRKKKSRSSSSGNDNTLVEHCRAEVSEHVPCGYTAMVRVDATSRRVADPMQEYYDAKVINPWTMSERILFLKLFIWNGKDIAKIARHLTFKSTHDVVLFYYEQKLTFRLKEMRARFVAGEVITDDDIIRLGRTGTVSANMAWNVSGRGEGRCFGGDSEGTVSQIRTATDASCRCDEARKTDRFTTRKTLGEAGNDREDVENLSVLSNTKVALPTTERVIVGSAAAAAARNKTDSVRPFTLKQGPLKQHALLMQL